MTWLTTYSGSHFDYSKPSIESINITDIAKALSHECRFAGQLERFYSVAQHCVECSYIVPAKFALEALLHDATEAYCKDIPSPLKKLLPDYQQIEKRVDLVVRQKFNLPLNESPEVKKADLIMLATEHRDIACDGKDWPMLNGVPLLQRKIEPLPSNIAFNRYIRRYEELINIKNLVRLSDMKLYSYFKHNKKIMQLVDNDFLDQFAVGYDHLIGERTNINLYTRVEPINVQIIEVNNH